MKPQKYYLESGNVLFFILIAIFLMGVLTVAIQMTSQSGNENVDNEVSIIRYSQVKQHAAELENAIRLIYDNGFSENDIRFAHPDANSEYGNVTDTPERQVFASRGGGVSYRLPPDDINDGSSWEFYGGTRMPEVGSDKAELLAVIPNVTQDFCDLVNESLGFTAQPEDSASCVNEGASGRFDNGVQFNTSPNITSEGTFTQTPATRACIECVSDGSLHYVHVIMAR